MEDVRTRPAEKGSEMLFVHSSPISRGSAGPSARRMAGRAARGPEGAADAPGTMSGMTALVAYATHSGATRTLAETLVGALTEQGVDCALVDLAEAPDPAGYDAVVLGSGVRIESVEKSASSWAKKYESTLAAKPFAFFSCSGGAANPAKREHSKATDGLLKDLSLTPVAVANFPGWVLMDRIPLHERVMLKSMRTPVGDFRDLDAVAAWGREIAPLLKG